MILITGASGFLGSVLTQQLLQQGHRVCALKRANSKIPAFLQNQPNLKWVVADLNDYFTLDTALEGITKIFHTAAFVSFNPSDKEKMLQTNVEGTANLVNLCLNKKDIRLVHVSSVAAVGPAKPNTMSTEADFLELNTQTGGYALSKHLSEMEVWRGIAEGLDAVIVNPSIIIGKETGWNGSGALFSTVKKGLNYYPVGSCGLVDVADVATAMIQLMESSISGERFILNAENWWYKDLFQEIAQGFGLKSPNKALSTWQLQMAAILSEMAGKLTGKTFGLNRETARSASKTANYSNEKIQKAIAIQFKPIRQSIAEICDSLK